MDTPQKTLAISGVTLYILGVIVTAIHLSRFGVFDVVLTKITYLLAGGVCALYLLIRVGSAVLLVDFRVVLSTLRYAQQMIHENLKDKILFRGMNFVFSRPLIRFLFGQFTSEGIATYLVRYIVLLAGMLVVVVFIGLFDLRNLELTFNDAIAFPEFIAFLILVQIGYIIWLYFYRVFKVTRLLRYFWNIIFSLLVVADIGFYGWALHPLVRPSFGGGAVYSVELFFRPDTPSAIQRFFEGESETMVVSAYLIHSVPAASYLTTRYEYSYTASLGRIIDFGDVVRIQATAIAALRIDSDLPNKAK